MSNIKPITEDVIKEYLLGAKTKLTTEQTKLFMGIAQSFNLNPFKREIYAIAYGSEFNIVTGYQVYIDRASASGLLDGRHAETVKDEQGKITGAKIVIYRKDWRMPFEWTVSISEFIKLKDGKPSGTRRTMPEFMIRKVAIGQGFRLAFPNELGGMPYLSEEITQHQEKDVIQGEVVASDMPETADASHILILIDHHKVAEKVGLKIAEDILASSDPVKEAAKNKSKVAGYPDNKVPNKQDYYAFIDSVVATLTEETKGS